EDDTFDPIVHTPSHVSSSDDEDSDNEVEGVDVEGEKSDDDATYVEDQGNEAGRDTNANLEGRDDVQADVVLPQVQVTQEIEDTHVTLTPVNPDGQQQSSSVSSGFVSNMLNPNQDTGVDAIFGHNAEATSLVDIPVTAIAEPSFFAPTNRPPTPTPLFTQLQQTPILTPATIPSSSLQNLPDFGLLFGFDHRLKALEDNFLEFKQTNQYAEALSSIPGIVDQYLANKMKEAVDVAVQLKSDRIREEAQTENQQFLDSIDEGMKKSEVLVRSSREAKTSHAIAANLSELELKKILIDKTCCFFSYQKKLNITKPDTYISNLRRRDAYTPYSDPRGFIYENKDKKNRLMRIDELHKFSDGTLDDVRTALNDRLKEIRMEYLPQTFWSQWDKANVIAMVKAIDKRLKTRRIMRSLKRFVGRRPYGGDLRLLQRTI
ncbi:hypothetical protein Tco_1153273, partial [Tanacetum coccineum]